MKFFLRQISSLILPVTVLGIVPYFIEHDFRFQPDILLVVGLVFVDAGLFLLGMTVSLLIHQGEGTLAPWSPTKNLVVSGIYAHVRNPMITGVMAVLLGEAALFHSVAILEWFGLFFLINNVYFFVSEEPGLVKRFGDEYLEYKKNVPRWIPRLSPWHRPDPPTKI